MNLQKLIEHGLKKKKRWIARGIERWISSFGSKKRGTRKRGGIVQRAWIRLRRIRFVSFAFCQSLVKFTENSSEQIDEDGITRPRNIHTFIRWKLFFILIYSYLKILKYHIQTRFSWKGNSLFSRPHKINIASITLIFGTNESIFVQKYRIRKREASKHDRWKRRRSLIPLVATLYRYFV